MTQVGLKVVGLKVDTVSISLRILDEYCQCSRFSPQPYPQTWQYLHVHIICNVTDGVIFPNQTLEWLQSQTVCFSYFQTRQGKESRFMLANYKKNCVCTHMCVHVHAHTPLQKAEHMKVFLFCCKMMMRNQVCKM